MSEYNIVRIMDLVESIGEDSVNEILSDFSCKYSSNQHNGEVEHFLWNNAVEFTKRKMSITYLIMDEFGSVAGFFTLTHKPIIINGQFLKSKTAKKKLERHAKYDPILNVYSVSAFLIAQFSKNYSLPSESQIDGIKLMEKALSTIEDIQEQIGGGIVFLECEDNEKLLHFYSMEPNKFLPFGERFSETEDTKYIQMMRFL